MQTPSSVELPLRLLTQRLGPLPLINHFIHRLGLAPILERCVPVGARPVTISHATILGLLLRSLLVEREPGGASFAQVRCGVCRPVVADVGQRAVALSTGDVAATLSS